MKNKVKLIESKMGNITQRWVDLLIPFSGDYSKRISVSELARKSKIPQQTVSRYLNNLVKFNLINYLKDISLEDELKVKNFILKCKIILENLNSEKIEEIRAEIKK